MDLRHVSAMDFDATITLNDHHLTAAGRRAEAVAAVRQAVERIDGAGWIDVTAHYYPPATPGWAIVYPLGCGVASDTAEWRDLQGRIEAEASRTLLNAAVIPAAPYTG